MKTEQIRDRIGRVHESLDSAEMSWWESPAGDVPPETIRHLTSAVGLLADVVATLVDRLDEDERRGRSCRLL